MGRAAPPELPIPTPVGDVCGRHKAVECQKIPCRFWVDWGPAEWEAAARMAAIRTECGIAGGFPDLDTEALARFPQHITVT